MRQELPICSRKHFPVNSVHLLIIETLLFLTIYMIEHIFPLCGKIHNHIRSYRYAFKALSTFLHLRETASEHI